MTLRDHYNWQEREAAELLDYVRSGGDVHIDQINKALRILGDTIGM